MCNPTPSTTGGSSTCQWQPHLAKYFSLEQFSLIAWDRERYRSKNWRWNTSVVSNVHKVSVAIFSCKSLLAVGTASAFVLSIAEPRFYFRFRFRFRVFAFVFAFRIRIRLASLTYKSSNGRTGWYPGGQGWRCTLEPRTCVNICAKCGRSPIDTNTLHHPHSVSVFVGFSFPVAAPAALPFVVHFAGLDGETSF